MHPNNDKHIGSLLLVCLAISLLAVNMRAPIVAIGSIAPILEKDLSISQVQIGWLGAVPMLMFALGALLSARLSKRFGMHNLLPTMILLLIIGMLQRVLILNWWCFFSGTVLLSLAIGFLNTLAMPAIKQLAPNKIPLVTGLFSLMMTTFAGVSAGFMLPMSETLGWRLATSSWVVISVFALFIWLKLRTGLKLDKSIDSNKNIEHYHKSLDVIPINVWKAPLAWQLGMFLGIQSLMYYMVASFLPSIWVSKGLTLHQSGQVAMVFQLMAPLAIIILTVLMNKKSTTKQVNPARPIAVIASVMIATGVLGMTFGSYDEYSSSQTLFWAYTWTILSGFGASWIFTLCLMLINLRTYDTEQAGEVSSMAQLVGYSIAIFGPLGTGWLYEVSHDWNVPLMVLSVLMLINVVFAWLASRGVMVDGKSIS